MILEAGKVIITSVMRKAEGSIFHTVSIQLFKKDSNRKYLPPHWTLVTLWYEGCKQNNNVDCLVNRKFFETEFHNLNLCLKRPLQRYLPTYVKLQVLSRNSDNKAVIENELKEHHAKANFAYQVKDANRSLKNDPTWKTITFDMQQCCLCLWLTVLWPSINNSCGCST